MPRCNYKSYPPLCHPYKGHDPRWCDACEWIERGIEIAEAEFKRKIGLIKQCCLDPGMLATINKIMKED